MIDEQGKLHLANPQRFRQELKQFKPCDVELIIKKKGKRSDKQNRYYWGVLVDEIRRRLQELGTRVDAETVHEFLKQKFNAEIMVTPDGEKLEFGRTTTDMNKGEMNEYMERIREWAALSLDISIPEPNEQTQIDYD